MLVLQGQRKGVSLTSILEEDSEHILVHYCTAFIGVHISTCSLKCFVFPLLQSCEHCSGPGCLRTDVKCPHVV